MELELGLGMGMVMGNTPISLLFQFVPVIIQYTLKEFKMITMRSMYEEIKEKMAGRAASEDWNYLSESQHFIKPIDVC